MEGQESRKDSINAFIGELSQDPLCRKYIKEIENYPDRDIIFGEIYDCVKAMKTIEALISYLTRRYGFPVKNHESR